MKEQSAVDFLHSKILFNIGLDDNDIFKLRELVKIAKKSEKQQIIKSRENGISEGYRRTNNFYYDKMVDSDTYFEKTYGSKGSDATSSQTEISDEEIFYQKQVMNPYPSTKHLYTAWEKGFMDCAKWYREQLKQL